ncbi:ABC transporter ATP-binding protein [Chlamydiales bacterium]|nr:ABC transporter ATP-binding protein [Chlamydiales bacterium]
MGKKLEFVGVSKYYGENCAVNNVSFSIDSREFFSILGPSGCGKTTLLRLVAGFEKPDKGSILLDGEDITHLPPNKRPVNTVFQSYALFPHLSLYENIAFGLRVQKKSPTIIHEEVHRMLKLIQMEDHAWKKPDQISGGQKQRVAIARALVNKPRLLLLDEPLAALDLKLRQKMLLELELFHDEVGITFVFVTHDQTEAMAVSDNIAVMNQGGVEQIGTPRELYETPKSSFVAAFIGDTNFLDGIVVGPAIKDFSELLIDSFPNAICYNDIKVKKGDFVHLSIRPEKIHISKEKPQVSEYFNVMKGTIDDIIYKGDHTKFWVKIGEYRLAVIQPHGRILEEKDELNWEDEVYIYWHGDDGYMLERYCSEDEFLTELPSEKIGEEAEDETEEE